MTRPFLSLLPNPHDDVFVTDYGAEVRLPKGEVLSMNEPVTGTCSITVFTSDGLHLTERLTGSSDTLDNDLIVLAETVVNRLRVGNGLPLVDLVVQERP